METSSASGNEPHDEADRGPLGDCHQQTSLKDETKGTPLGWNVTLRGGREMGNR